MLGRLIFSLNSSIAKKLCIVHTIKWHNSLHTILKMLSPLVNNKYTPQPHRSTVRKPCRQQFDNRAMIYPSLQSTRFTPQLLNLIRQQPQLCRLQLHTRVTLLQVYLMLPLRATHILDSVCYSNRLLQLSSSTCLHSLLQLHRTMVELTRWWLLRAFLPPPNIASISHNKWVNSIEYIVARWHT